MPNMTEYDEIFAGISSNSHYELGCINQMSSLDALFNKALVNI
jgi:hypothetical protein